MSTSTIPKIVTTMSSKNPSSPSSTTCKSVQQQDEQQHQQQQQQQQQQLQSSENNIVMKSFPWKLYLLLERCDYEKKYIYPTSTHAAIQWNMSSSINSDRDISDGYGKSFIIQNKEKFTKDILPHFFKCANNTKNKNNSNNDDINNNDGRNFDIFQANIDMWYVVLRIVAYCCVLLCCVAFSHTVCALSISCALLFGTYFFTLSCPLYTQILSFVILIFRSYINRGFTTTRIRRTNKAAVVGAVAADNSTDNSSNATTNDDDDDDYVYCYSHPLFIKGFPFACEGMKVKS